MTQTEADGLRRAHLRAINICCLCAMTCGGVQLADLDVLGTSAQLMRVETRRATLAATKPTRPAKREHCRRAHARPPRSTTETNE